MYVGKKDTMDACEGNMRPQEHVFFHTRTFARTGHRGAQAGLNYEAEESKAMDGRRKRAPAGHMCPFRRRKRKKHPDTVSRPLVLNRPRLSLSAKMGLGPKPRNPSG